MHVRVFYLIRRTNIVKGWHKNARKPSIRGGRGMVYVTIPPLGDAAILRITG
ncbi:MAG: hypothetical protein JXN61_13530 [Sedimentisphaerales bacterium]|nr:hypothetical protein [Sedimentisphaerales bacterium]